MIRQARSNGGLSRQCLPQIWFIPLNFYSAQKCFKHIIRTKIFHPKNVFCPSNLKTCLWACDQESTYRQRVFRSMQHLFLRSLNNPPRSFLTRSKRLLLEFTHLTGQFSIFLHLLNPWSTAKKQAAKIVSNSLWCEIGKPRTMIFTALSLTKLFFIPRCKHRRSVSLHFRNGPPPLDVERVWSHETSSLTLVCTISFVCNASICTDTIVITEKSAAYAELGTANLA